MLTGGEDLLRAFCKLFYLWFLVTRENILFSKDFTSNLKGSFRREGLKL